MNVFAQLRTLLTNVANAPTLMDAVAAGKRLDQHLKTQRALDHFYDCRTCQRRQSCTTYQRLAKEAWEGKAS